MTRVDVVKQWNYLLISSKILQSHCRIKMNFAKRIVVDQIFNFILDCNLCRRNSSTLKILSKVRGRASTKSTILPFGHRNKWSIRAKVYKRRKKRRIRRTVSVVYFGYFTENEVPSIVEHATRRAPPFKYHENR